MVLNRNANLNQITESSLKLKVLEEGLFGEILGSGVSSTIISPYMEYKYDTEKSKGISNFVTQVTHDLQKVELLELIYRNENLYFEQVSQIDEFKNFDLDNDYSDCDYDELCFAKNKDMSELIFHDDLAVLQTARLEPINLYFNPATINLLENISAEFKERNINIEYSGEDFTPDLYSEILDECFKSINDEVDDYSDDEISLCKDILEAIKKSFIYIKKMDERYKFTFDLHREQFCSTYANGYNQVICIDPILFI